MSSTSRPHTTGTGTNIQPGQSPSKVDSTNSTPNVAQPLYQNNPNQPFIPNNIQLTNPAAQQFQNQINQLNQIQSAFLRQQQLIQQQQQQSQQQQPNSIESQMKSPQMTNGPLGNFPDFLNMLNMLHNQNLNLQIPQINQTPAQQQPLQTPKTVPLSPSKSGQSQHTPRSATTGSRSGGANINSAHTAELKRVASSPTLSDQSTEITKPVSVMSPSKSLSPASSVSTPSPVESDRLVEEVKQRRLALMQAIAKNVQDDTALCNTSASATDVVSSPEASKSNLPRKKQNNVTPSSPMKVNPIISPSNSTGSNNSPTLSTPKKLEDVVKLANSPSTPKKLEDVVKLANSPSTPIGNVSMITVPLSTPTPEANASTISVPSTPTPVANASTISVPSTPTPVANASTISVPSTPVTPISPPDKKIKTTKREQTVEKSPPKKSEIEPKKSSTADKPKAAKSSEEQVPSCSTSEPMNRNVEIKGKRHRTKTNLYQSPTPELVLATRISFSEANKTSSSSKDKLIIFYADEFIAVRNDEGTFYIGQCLHNMYAATKKCRIRWLTDKRDNTYDLSFFDTVDKECILTSVSLENVSKDRYKLTDTERERIDSILQKSIDVEKGILPRPVVTEENPDGLDISLYKNESQIKTEDVAGHKRKAESSPKSSSPTKKVKKNAKTSKPTTPPQRRKDIGSNVETPKNKQKSLKQSKQKKMQRRSNELKKVGSGSMDSKSSSKSDTDHASTSKSDVSSKDTGSKKVGKAKKQKNSNDPSADSSQSGSERTLRDRSKM